MKIIPNETMEQRIVSLAWGVITGAGVWSFGGPLWAICMTSLICLSVAYMSYAVLNLLRGL